MYNITPIIEPCNGCNYECLRENEKCAKSNEITKNMDQLISSSLVYFIIPNYCGFPNANYFSFNERTVGYFNGGQQLLQKYYSIKKKYIIVSNSKNKIFLKAMEQQSAEPEILYLSSAAYGKTSIDGDLMESEQAKADLRAFLVPHNAL